MATESQSAAPAKKSKLVPAVFSLSDNAEGAAAQVGRLVESTLRRVKRQVEVDPIETFDPRGVAERVENRRKADDALAFGTRQFENLEDRHGIESFNRAIALYEHTALWDTFPDLVRANMMRLLVTWPEDRTLGRREIERLVALAPDVEFPAEYTSPELAADIQRAKDRVAGETRVSVDVSSEPVAARVYVDGVFRGTAPVTVRGLLPGEHYISFVAPGYKVVQRTALVTAGATATEKLEPAEDATRFLSFLEKMQTNFRAPEEVAAAQVLARAAGADEVLSVGVERTAGVLTIEMHRIVASDGHVIALETMKVNERDPELALKVEALTERVLVNDRPRDGAGRPLSVLSATEKLVENISNISGESVRLVVGVSAAALVASGVALGVMAHSKEADLRTLTQVDARVEDLHSSGRSMAIASDVLVGSGLVAGSVWAWMQFGSKARAKGQIAPEPSPTRRSTPEKKQDPPKKKDDGVWDPWAMQAPAAPAWVRPTIGFGHVGLEGGF